MSTHNPFNNTKVVHIQGGAALAASTDSDLAALIDVSAWEHLTIIVAAGTIAATGDVAGFTGSKVVVEYEQFTADTPASAVKVTGAELLFTETEDDKTKAMVINLRDKQQFGNVRIRTGAGGTSGLGVTMVLSRPLTTEFDIAATDEPLVHVE